MPSEQTTGGVLGNSRFRLLWVAQAISQTAQNIISISLLIEVGRLTASSVQHSLVVLSFIVPPVILAPFAGVVVDHSDKRTVLVLTNLLRVGVALGFTLINPSWPLGSILLSIYLLSVLFTCISQFFAPAEASAIPLLVSVEQLTVANSLFQLTLFSAQIVGFSILGPLFVKTLAFRTIFIVAAGLYAFCVLLTALLPRLAEGARPILASSYGEEIRGAWSEFLEVLRFISKEGAIATAITDIALTTSVYLMLATLGVGLVAEVFRLPSSDLAYLMASGGAGLVVCLALLPHLAVRVPRQSLITFGLGLMGASIALMAVSNLIVAAVLGDPSHTLYNRVALGLTVVLAFGIGFGSALVTVPSQTLLQEETPAVLRGRVFASLFAVTSALSILPVLFTGALADFIGLQESMVLVGLATLSLALLEEFSRRR